VAVNSLQRRGLVNASVAAVATFAIGSAVVYAAGGPDDVAAPPRSSRPSASPTTPSCAPTWDVVRSANPGEAATTLLGVTAVTSAEAWAVGGLGEPEIPTAVAIQRWDGDRWLAIAGPSPGSTLNELRAVDASEPNDVWAVGRTSSGFGEQPLVLHYDGTTWSDVELPSEIDGVLNGVAAISPSDVWAVGAVGDPAASLERALVLHWDGTAWADVELGRAAGGGKSALVDVEGISPTDLWAVGYHHFRPLILRFDGEAWSQNPTEIRGTLHAIEANAPSEAWAVGTPIQRFDGEAWTEAPIAHEDAELVDVAAIGGLDIWAVGSRPSKEPGTTRAAVYRYGGRRWVPVDGPSVAGSDALSAVDALPDGTLLAVGWKDVGLERETLAIRGTTCPPAS
jgi:hypothetical protein